MNLWQFAIARKFSQLSEESKRRTLTDKEIDNLEACALCVEQYEAEELQQQQKKGTHA